MKIILPLSVTLPRKTKADKVFTLNLNIYRNSHHMTLNQAKVAWKDIVAVAVQGLPFNVTAPHLFTYTVFPGSGRSFDIANVCSIIDKFTCDALQELGIIANDNYKSIPMVIYRIGKIDKENPRCELVITSFNLEE